MNIKHVKIKLNHVKIILNYVKIKINYVKIKINHVKIKLNHVKMKLNVGLPEILLDLGIITSTNGNYLLITRNAEEFIIRWRETKRMDLTEKIDRGQEKAWIV